MQGCLACHISYIAKWKPPKDTSFSFLTGELQRSGGFNEKFFSGKNSKIGIPKNLKTVFTCSDSEVEVMQYQTSQLFSLLC